MKINAFLLQLEDLHENDFRMLCRHLGHTTEVHNRWYRMSDVTIELTKVGEILDSHFNNANTVTGSSNEDR